MLSVPHCTDQYANNRAELSHEPTRRRERQMRRFKSAGQAQRFLAVHAAIGNLFRVGRHLMRASHQRECQRVTVNRGPADGKCFPLRGR